MVQCARENLFRDCADPGCAIPSAASDRALAAVERAVVAERNPIVLLGPEGTGKTLLLRRIVGRAPPSTRTVFLPWLNPPAEDLTQWIRGFDGAARGSDYDFVAVARSLHEAGIRTLLLVDEAQSIPHDTAQRLSELVSESGNAVQVILAGIDLPALHAAVTAFPGAAEYVELAGEVTPQEVASWVHGALDADELSLLKDLDWLELIQQTEGVPRLIRWELERRLATGELATALSRETVQTPSAVAEAAPEAESGVAVAPDAELIRARATERSTSLAESFAATGELAASLGRLAADGFRRLELWIRGTIHTIPQGLRGLRGLVARIVQRSRSVTDERAPVVAGFAAAAFDAVQRTAEQAAERASNGVRGIGARLPRLVQRSRSATAEMARGIAGFATPALDAVRGAAERGAMYASDFLRAKRSDSLSRRLRPRISGSLRHVLDLKVSPLAFPAIVAALAFFLGRMTAPSPEVAPGAPQIASSGPPTAPQEASPRPPAPAPPPHPANMPRATPAAPKHILVTIEAHPRARIWIDGHAVGRTPLARVPLVPGRHHFQVAFSDGRKIHRTLEIHQGTHVVKFS